MLTRNYRNGSQILAAAMRLVAGSPFADLNADEVPGQREVDVERAGRYVAVARCDDARSQRTAPLNALRWALAPDVHLGDMAVLVRTNASVRHCMSVLHAAGVAAQELAEYDGYASEAVKVGTYQRAKGLEFACVFLPDHDLAVPQPGDGDDGDREAADLARRQLFVAMTRARDRLWLGNRVDRATVGSSS